MKQPAAVDYNLIVIGAGAAGLVAAYTATAVKARVALIEQDKMGGDCLHSGCVPSKALIRSARILAQAGRAREFGFKSIQVDFDFAGVMERVQRVINTIVPHDSAERYTALGVDCYQGQARILTPWCVTVNGQQLTTANIIIATGARPSVPPVPGFDEVGYYTTDSIWSLRQLPGRLLVLGGGPAGLELGQCFVRLGSKVTLVETLPRILNREDPEVSNLITTRLRQEGMEILTQHQLRKCTVRNGEKIAVCAAADGVEREIIFDALLVAVGRNANTEKLGLEELRIALTARGTIATDHCLRTNYPNIFACGDVAGPYQLTHMAAYQARLASVNALFGGIWKFRTDYAVAPAAIFTEPELARVGLNEQEASANNIAYETTRYDLADLDRAIADETATGLVKVLTVPGKDRILGATIVGEHAAELITIYISAMRNDYGMNRILNTTHIYPTLAEAVRFAAGNWRRAHAPRGLLKLAEWLHRWRRG
ncbi:MAG: pyridine nucleotide-disulfide oxidoreductase [Gammaproteobacteria bacterium]|nr:pyridine nucleotide-disulfide oxidoreductase [Gammaproteobacteria bacterium]